MRFVGYGRHSSDLQNPESAEDQLHDVKRAGEEKGWKFIRGYADNAVSGTSVFHRAQFLEMREAAGKKEFDCIVVEDIDRLSRNLGDLAKFCEQMEFYGIPIYSLLKGGFVGAMDIGFKGTMSAQFIKDLSQKTKRGLSANIRNGKSAGSMSYGYKATVKVGVVEIDEEKAEIVRKIFLMYSQGNTPRMIAGALNKEKIPSPRGGDWSASTINGHVARGVGIIRNPLYIGRRVWGRNERVRNPMDGSAEWRSKPVEAQLTQEVPELRILKQELWDAVQESVRTFVYE